LCHISVSVGPGPTALTVMFLSASSSAQVRSSPIPNRKLDTFGIAYYYLGFSDSFKNLAPPFLRDERGLELFYNVAVTPWFHVTADLQVITPLLQPVHNSLVLGLRSKIDF
jgi:porin